MWLNVIAERLTDDWKHPQMIADGIFPANVVDITVEELLSGSMAPNTAYWCRGPGRLLTTTPLGETSAIRAEAYFAKRAPTSQSTPGFWQNSMIGMLSPTLDHVCPPRAADFRAAYFDQIPHGRKKAQFDLLAEPLPLTLWSTSS